MTGSAAHLFAAAQRALERLDPARLVADSLSRNPFPGPDKSALLFALGKSAIRMAEGAASTGARFERGLVIAPHRSGNPTPAFPEAWQQMTGNHPVSGARSFAAGRAALDFFRSQPDLPLLALVSGGGSALAELPRPPLDEADLSAIGAALLASGRPITEINQVRRALSAIKGGGLLSARRAVVRTLVLSDVGDDPAVVASGPTLPPPAIRIPPRDLAQVLGRSISRELSVRIERALATPPPERLPESEAVLLASPSDFARSVASELEADGFAATIDASNLDANAVEFAEKLSASARRLLDSTRPAAAIFVGEPTIALPPEAPAGGRAAHVALATAVALADADCSRFTLLAFASDGVDGTAGGGGALLTPEIFATLAARRAGCVEALARFEADRWLRDHGARLPAVPTGSNLRDLFVLATGG